MDVIATCWGNLTAIQHVARYVRELPVDFVGIIWRQVFLFTGAKRNITMIRMNFCDYSFGFCTWALVLICALVWLAGLLRFALMSAFHMSGVDCDGQRAGAPADLH